MIATGKSIWLMRFLLPEAKTRLTVNYFLSQLNLESQMEFSFAHGSCHYLFYYITSMLFVNNTAIIIC